MPVYISLIIPAHNVEKTLEIVVEQSIQELKKIEKTFELIIAEDGSRDKTYSLAKKLSTKYKSIKIFHSDRRLGKGGALTNSFKKSRGELRIFIDADYVDVPKYLNGMVSLLMKCDIVIGSRYTKLSKSRRLFKRLLASKVYNMLAKLFFLLPISDMQCGFKGMSKNVVPVLSQIRSSDYFWDTEFLVKSRRLGHRICELPITWKEERSKNSASLIKDSFKFIKSLIKLRLGLL